MFFWGTRPQFTEITACLHDEMSCTLLAENTGRKKIAKKSTSGHHRTILSRYIFATKARIDNRKKFVKQQYLLHMSS